MDPVEFSFFLRQLQLKLSRTQLKKELARDTTPTPHSNTNTALMHHQAAVEAAPRLEKGECATRLVEHTLLLQGHWYPSARSVLLDKVEGAVQTATSLATTDGFMLYKST